LPKPSRKIFIQQNEQSNVSAAESTEESNEIKGE
jgi:hypothetical protein